MAVKLLDNSHRLTQNPAGRLVHWLTSPVGAMLAAVVLIAGFRLLTLGTFALTDNTEARYAEIGWQMCRSGDWVTPRLYMSGELVPFWAKPPLFFWTTAMSFRRVRPIGMGGSSAELFFRRSDGRRHDRLRPCPVG